MDGPPAALSSKADATRLLLLSELAARRHATLRSLAERLDVSVQAVSDYLRRMGADGLVEDRAGFHAPTRDGIEWLHARLRELRDWISAAYERLRIIDTTTAIAGAAVREGDAVGLFMEDGRLVCYPGRRSPSRGRALAAVRRGEDVAVGALEGVVDLAPGTLTVLLLPGGLSGGSRAVDPKRLRSRIGEAGDALLAAMGPVAQAALAKARLPPAIAHAPVEAALDACVTGRSVVLVASADEERDLFDRLAASGRAAGRLSTRIVRLERARGGSA